MGTLSNNERPQRQILNIRIIKSFNFIFNALMVVWIEWWCRWYLVVPRALHIFLDNRFFILPGASCHIFNPVRHPSESERVQNEV